MFWGSNTSSPGIWMSRVITQDFMKRRNFVFTAQMVILGTVTEKPRGCISQAPLVGTIGKQ